MKGALGREGREEIRLQTRSFSWRARLLIMNAFLCAQSTAPLNNMSSSTLTASLLEFQTIDNDSHG